MKALTYTFYGLLGNLILMTSLGLAQGSLARADWQPENRTLANTTVQAAAADQTDLIAIQAMNGGEIEFVSQNGVSKTDLPAPKKTIPHLVLTRNDALTAPEERTLIISLGNLEIPQPGAWVSVRVETQHGDPDRGGSEKQRIRVWQETRWVPSAPEGATTGNRLDLRYEFGEQVSVENRNIPTPTDYYRLEVEVNRQNGTGDAQATSMVIEYAFLMENQWMADLPAVGGEAGGTAPERLVIYACDMIPYQYNISDTQTRLPRTEVQAFIRDELIPSFMNAYEKMSNEWGFSWHPEWTSYRSNEDPGVLSITLSDGVTWYHGKAPATGLSGISVKVSAGSGEQAHYSSILERIDGTLQHELFHNLQRSMALHFSGRGEINGKENSWGFFTEGTATMVASVLAPEFQLSKNTGIRDYLYSASAFITQDLNHSYAELKPYHAALYWRFLYEQCSRGSNGVENPADGMQIIRRALEALYSGAVVDIHTSTDLTERFPAILDRALEGSSCKFQSYRQSLLAFTQAIYVMRLESSAPEKNAPGNFRMDDPNHLYPAPAVEEVSYTGEAQSYAGEISSSYGMDFIEIRLDPQATRQVLTVDFYNPSESPADFSVQLWKLVENETGQPGAVDQPVEISTGKSEAQGGWTRYQIQLSEKPKENRLALLITRVDSHEKADPTGNYQINIH